MNRATDRVVNIVTEQYFFEHRSRLESQEDELCEAWFWSDYASSWR